MLRGVTTGTVSPLDASVQDFFFVFLPNLLVDLSHEMARGLSQRQAEAIEQYFHSVIAAVAVLRGEHPSPRRFWHHGPERGAIPLLLVEFEKWNSISGRSAMAAWRRERCRRRMRSVWNDAVASYAPYGQQPLSLEAERALVLSLDSIVEACGRLGQIGLWSLGRFAEWIAPQNLAYDNIQSGAPDHWRSLAGIRDGLRDGDPASEPIPFRRIAGVRRTERRGIDRTKDDATALSAEDTMAVNIFFSYAHKDEELRDAVEVQLGILKREGLITSWHDRGIHAGDDWDLEISDRLEKADLILLLVSADFVGSDYCYDNEMQRAMARHDAHECVVVPIILRDCDWHTAPFGKLQALPKDGRPITSWDNQDEALADVARGLRRLITSHRS